MTIQDYLKQSAMLCELLISEKTLGNFPAIVKCIIGHFQSFRPLLICGNGGSAADSAHITAELVGRFQKKRKALPCLCLNDAATMTAWGNDVHFETYFARGVEAYGQQGGALLVISTSGNSRNVIAAAQQAKMQGMDVIGLLGRDGGLLKSLCDYTLVVPNQNTALIQQGHQCLYHYLCAEIEAAFPTPSDLDPS